MSTVLAFPARRVITAEQDAADRVERELGATVSADRCALACSRARKHVRRGVELREAVRRAVAWARCCDETPPPSAA